MKRQTLLLLTVAALASSSTAYASITNARWTDDGDGAVVCGNNWLWNAGSTTLSMSGDQFDTPGHMVGTIFTSSAEDPTLTLASAVNNDTGLAWSAYTVNVYMAVPFTISGVSVANQPNPDWSYAVGAVAQQASGPYAGLYEGTLSFSSGTLVQPGGELDWTYSITFKNATQYSFTQEMIPTQVPEPGSLALLALGGLLCAGWRSRRQQS